MSEANNCRRETIGAAFTANMTGDKWPLLVICYLNWDPQDTFLKGEFHIFFV